MGLNWTLRKQGADGIDGLLLIQVETVLTRTGHTVAGYEWYAYEIKGPNNHVRIATSDVYYKHHRPKRSRKAAIQAAEEWYAKHWQQLIMEGTRVTIKAGAISQYGNKFDVDTSGTLIRNYHRTVPNYGIRLDAKRVVLIPREFVRFFA